MTTVTRFAPALSAVMLGLCATAAHAEPRLDMVAVLAEGASSLEGLDQGRDGAIYLTSNFDNKIMKVKTDGTRIGAVDVPFHPQVNLFTEDGGIVVTGHDRVPAFGPNGPTGVTGLGTAVAVLDAKGKLIRTTKGPDDAFFNGIAEVSRGRYLIADTIGGRLWLLDIAKGSVEPWLTDVSAEGARGKGNFGGANGIKIHDGAVFYTSRGAMWKVGIGRDGKPAGAPMEFAKLPGDDFTIAKDGTMYVPSGTALMKISSKGEVTKVIDLGVNCPTAWLAKDEKSVFLLTRGGFPGTPNPPPSKLLRVWL